MRNLNKSVFSKYLKMTLKCDKPYKKIIKKKEIIKKFVFFWFPNEPRTQQYIIKTFFLWFIK